MTRFFSFDARITRLRLLAGIVVGLAIGWLCILLLRQTTGVATPLVGGIAGVTIVKLIVEAGRRRRDMGASVGGGLLALVAAMIGVGVSLVHMLGTGEVWLYYPAIGLFVLLWAMLLLRPGAPGMAAVGLTPTFDASAPRAGGTVLAILLAITGASLGIGANLWIDAMAGQRLRDEAAANEPIAPANGDEPDNLEAIYAEQQR